MKILHINTGQHGGAALCAIRINRALSAEDVDSQMLFAEGKMMPNGVEGAVAQKDRNPWESNTELRKVKNLLVKLPMRWPMDAEKFRYRLNRANTQHCYMHQPLSNYKNISHHPLVKWADVVHLHWVSDFIDYPTFFKEVRKPIVWTLHDQNPATGLLHYETSKQSPLNEQLNRLDILCRCLKRKSVQQAYNLNIVAISKEMAEVCRSSDVLKGFPTTLINNGIEDSLFVPVDQQMARIILGIPANNVVFAFCAQNIGEKRKGLKELIGALERIGRKDITLLCIGGGELPVKTSLNVVKTGTVNSTRLLSALYSSADYFVMPSFQEAFAQTPMEAMACGTPVIAFPCSGTEELISDVSGVRCSDFTVDALVDAIKVAFDKKFDCNCVRNSLISQFQYKIIAQKYIELYTKIIAS